MRVLNASSFGRADIIFRAYNFTYHKSVCVMVCMQLKDCFLAAIVLSYLFIQLTPKVIGKSFLVATP